MCRSTLLSAAWQSRCCSCCMLKRHQQGEQLIYCVIEGIRMRMMEAKMKSCDKPWTCYTPTNVFTCWQLSRWQDVRHIYIWLFTRSLWLTDVTDLKLARDKEVKSEQLQKYVWAGTIYSKHRWSQTLLWAETFQATDLQMRFSRSQNLGILNPRRRVKNRYDAKIGHAQNIFCPLE